MTGREQADHALERLVFFSDAVFAIAITLLVVEIPPPHLPSDATDEAHWRALANLIPNFIGYAISFGGIGMFWMGHHRAFMLTGRYHSRVLGWNLLLLAMIAFMPFLTAYSSANYGQRVPATIYCFALLMAAMVYFRVNILVTSADMVREDVRPEQVRDVRDRGVALILAAGTSCLLTLVVPRFAQLGMTTFPLWRLVIARWRALRDRRLPHAMPNSKSSTSMAAPASTGSPVAI